MDFTLSPKQWLLDYAASRWLDHGVDWKNGGFFETVDAQTLIASGSEKRLRTVSRQIFAFCELHRFGSPKAIEVVEHGLNFLLHRHARGDGAFHERVTMHGEPIDARTSLYDLAFVLFALAKAYSVQQDPVLRTTALSLLDYIQQHMRHPEWGFYEWLPVAESREQNPHMHLLEAALAWLDNDPDGPFRALAGMLLDAVAQQLFQSEVSVLSEFPQSSGGERAEIHRFEPGHHFEWIWLLDWAALHDLSVPLISRALEERALRDGVSLQTHVPFGALTVPGGITEQECRIWQVTEWARAAALGLLQKTLEEDQRSVQLLARFLNFHTPGFWYERCHSVDGNMIEEPVKATSFYHVLGAIIALIERKDSISIMPDHTARHVAAQRVGLD